jgi:E3 ubiquitin-protein ligase HECTD1
MDLGQGTKPKGYYIQRPSGLFPAPYPQDHPDIEQVEKLFHHMGTFFAKCIQDNRLVDIPLSRPFLKLMCMGDVVDNVSQNYRELLMRRESEEFSPHDDDLTPTEDMDKELLIDVSRPSRSPSMLSSMGGSPWFTGLLTQEDFELVDPHRAKFMKQLQDLAAAKQAILSNKNLTEAQKKTALKELTFGNPPARLDDIG